MVLCFCLLNHYILLLPVPRPGQSPVSMEIDEKQEKGASEMEKSDKSDEPASKSKEELQREQREDEQRKRKEKLEEEERKRKERIEEEERKKKERIEEAQRERRARIEEAQRLAEEARQERLDRKSMTESIASPDSTEDSRWKDKKRRRRDDSESRGFTACDDNQDPQETVERSDKTPGLYWQKEIQFLKTCLETPLHLHLGCTVNWNKTKIMIIDFSEIIKLQRLRFN